MKKGRLIPVLFLTLVMSLVWGSVFGTPLVQAARSESDVDSLYMATVKPNEDGRYEIPTKQDEISALEWSEVETDGYVHIDAYSHSIVLFAKEDESGDKVIIPEPVRIYEADPIKDNEGNISGYTKRKIGENQEDAEVIVDGSSVNTYRYWNEDEEILVPGVYDFGLGDGAFIVEYDGCSMTICSDKPLLGVYVKQSDSSNEWYNCESWDGRLDYALGGMYYVGAQINFGELDDDNTAEEKISLNVNPSDDNAVNITNDIIVDFDAGMAYRQFTIKDGYIRNFSIDPNFEYHIDETDNQNGGTHIELQALRDGLFICGCDNNEDNVWRNGDDTKSFHNNLFKTDRFIYLGYSNRDVVTDITDLSEVTVKKDGVAITTTDFLKSRGEEEGNEGYYYFNVAQEGTYTLEYNGSKAEIVCELPKIAIYKSNEISVNRYAIENGLVSYEEGDNTKYYVNIRKDDGETISNVSLLYNPVYNGNELKEDDSQKVGLSEQVAAGDFLSYSFSIPDDAEESFDVLVVYDSKYDGDEETKRKSDDGFRFELKKTGLVIGDVKDGKDENDRDTRVFVDDINRFEKSRDTAIGDEMWVSLGIVSEVDEGNVLTPVNNDTLETELGYFAIKDDNGNAVGKDVAYIANTSREWVDDKEQDVPTEDGVFIIVINQCGKYSLEYMNGDVTSSVTIYATLPDVGIYSANEATEENFLSRRWDFEYTPGTEYFVLLSDNFIEDAKRRDDFQNVVIDFDEALGKKSFVWNTESTVKGTSFTVPATCFETMEPGVNATFNYSWIDDGEQKERREEQNIKFFAKSEGLIIGEARWDDDGVTPYPEKFNDYYKFYKMDNMSEYEVNIGMLSNDGSTITAVPAADVNKFTITLDGKDVTNNVDLKAMTVWREEEKEDVVVDGYFNIRFNKEGLYTVTYNNSSIQVRVVMPTFAIYNSKDELQGDRAYYTDKEKVFSIKAHEEDDEDITITKVELVEGKDDYIDYSISKDGKSCNVNIGNLKVRSFALCLTYDIKWLDPDGVVIDERTDEQSRWFKFEPGDGIIDLYLDGEPQQGYSGAYIPEDWFENGEWTSDSEYPMYWVHAASAQEVVDKLSETAVGGKFEGWYMDGNGEWKKATEEVNVVNTGYITIAPSTYGGEALEPQYVASSGNLKGIVFEGASSHAYFVKPDEDGNYEAVTGKKGGSKDFYETGVFYSKQSVEALETMISKGKLDYQLTDADKTAIQETAGVIIYKGKLYAAKVTTEQYTTRDNKDTLRTSNTYTFRDRTPLIGVEFDEAQEGMFCEMTPQIKFTESMAGVHVNAYCDMEFIGDMGNLVIGYPDKTPYFSTLAGDYCQIKVKEGNETHTIGGNVYRNITGPDYAPDGKTITHPTSSYTYEGGKVLETDFTYNEEIEGSYSYPIKTYIINSDSEVGGTFEGVEVEVPEPNSLTELSLDQKDEIEKGEKLTVSMTADTVDEASADKETQEGIAAIKEEIAGDTGNDYGRIDYIDLSVKASVGDMETQITETAVPMTVTIPIPKGYKKGSMFRIARYHKGKVFFFDIVDSLLKEVGFNIGYTLNEKEGTLTFLTDRFSTYALMEIGEDSRTKVDFSKTAWNYKEAFTADGTNKKVELTGLPEGVTVTYSGNEAKEVGKYTAKASISVTDAKSYKLPDEIPAAITSLSWEIKVAEAALVTPSPAGSPETQTTPAPAEVGATVTDTSAGGAASTSTYTVTDKSTGAGDAGEVTYSGESTGSTATSVTIPATITGADGVTYEVTKIADNALKGNKTVKEVTVGDNIVEVGTAAFQNATKLTTVKLGKKVTALGKNAFAGCTSLKKVTASGSAITTIGEGAFNGDKALASVDFSKSKIKSIGKNAFNGNKKLKNIKLNGNVLTKVGKNAFKNIKKKAAITIYAKDKKTYNKVVKLIKKSGAKNVKYKFKKKK